MHEFHFFAKKCRQHYRPNHARKLPAFRSMPLSNIDKASGLISSPPVSASPGRGHQNVPFSSRFVNTQKLVAQLFADLSGDHYLGSSNVFNSTIAPCPQAHSRRFFRSSPRLVRGQVPKCCQRDPGFAYRAIIKLQSK